jgi:hypothetical protein
MVTVCALYAHVIAFAAACAEVGAQEARKTQHKATHRKEEKSNILSFLPLLLLFEDGETAEEKADAFFAFFSKSLVVIFADDENVSCRWCCCCCRDFNRLSTVYNERIILIKRLISSDDTKMNAKRLFSRTAQRRKHTHKHGKRERTARARFFTLRRENETRLLLLEKSRGLYKFKVPFLYDVREFKTFRICTYTYLNALTPA